jgi:hypothetical protein
MFFFKQHNDHVDRAPANTVSKVRNGPTGASVQHFVLRLPFTVASGEKVVYRQAQ